MRKSMSVITAMLLSLCIIIMPMTTAAAVDDTTPAGNSDDNSFTTETSIGDVSVSNSTDFGDLLNNEIAEKEAEQQENMGNNIFSVTVENDAASVEFETTQNSTIVVGIYDEQGIQMITSASIAVTPEQKNIDVELDNEKMPEYFYIKAFIVDSDTLRPMCTVYESPNYTQEMQEFFAMTTDDFEEEQVLNLDESKQNNFAVYKESTIVIQKKANANIVVSVDGENDIYVIQNPDDTLRGLQIGDIFAYDYSDDDIIIAKVAQTVISGDTITITGTDDFDISDVFDYIKLDQSAGEQDEEEQSTTNNSGMKTTSTSAGVQDWGIDNEYKLKANVNLFIDRTFKDDEEDPIGSVTFKGSLTGSIGGSFKYYLHLSDQYIEFKLESSLTLSGSISGKLQAKIPLVKLGVKIPKTFEVDFSPCFEVSVSGSITLSGTVNGTAVLRIGTKGVSKQNTVKVDFDVKIEVTVFIGITFEPKINVLNLAEASVKAQIGAEIKGKWGLVHLSTDNERHTCSGCIDGSVQAVARISAKAKLSKLVNVEDKIEWSKKLCDFYYSADYNEFGFGKCPHKEYKCTVTVNDSNGNPVSSATINDTYTTDSNGKVVVYLKPKNVTLIAKKDNSEGKYEGDITAPTAITITFNQEYIAKGDWVQCRWSINKDGKLTIEGTIPEVFKESDTPWNQYREQITEVYAKPYTKASGSVHSIFANLVNAKKINLSQLDTSNATNMYAMFKNCQSLQLLNISHFDTSKVMHMSNMFRDCKALRMLDVSSFDTAKVISMSEMFEGCSSLESLDVSGFDTAKVVSMSQMFRGCSSLELLDVSGFDTSNVTNMGEMFGDCWELKSLDVSNFNTSKVTTMFSLFYNCQNVQLLDVSNFDTSRVTSMSNMFYACKKLQSLDLSNFNTSNVEHMGCMFDGCSSLTMVNVSSFDTSSVTGMSSMFSNCSKLISVDLSSFDTSNVTRMSGMFYGCNNLATLDLSNFNTSNVTDMFGMFNGCKNLATLDLGSFDTSNVTDMTAMFYECGKLDTLDLSSFDTNKVNKMGYMFAKTGLYKIFVSDGWNVKNVTSGAQMFLRCTSLVGGAGTGYNSSHVGVDYAHIDGGTSNPGYLTAKTQTTSTAARMKTTSTAANVVTTAQLTENYADLEPNETYNFYVMKEVDTEEPLNSDNLYYITQAQADENGELTINYAPTEEYDQSYRFVVAYHRKNVAYAQVTATDLTYTAEEQYIKPTVILDDVTLVEGVDYELTGDYSATDAGEYTVTINGIGNYTGTLDYTYIIIDYSQIPEQGEKINAVAATCTTDGNIEYYILYGRYYTLQNDTFVEISLDETVIPKTGHNYVCNAGSDQTSEGHTMVCTRCGDIVVGEHIYDENDICTECGYEKDSIVPIDWSKATFEFTDGSNGLYRYTKKMISPEFTITCDGVVLEENVDFDFTEDSEEESKRAGKHTIIVCDKNDETNTFSFDYYIYDLKITVTETANTVNKVRFSATRNADKVNMLKFGMILDKTGNIGENLSLDNYTHMIATTTKSISKYNANIIDTGNGVWGKPFMRIWLNGAKYVVYGDAQFLTRYTAEQIAVPTMLDIPPELVNGKVAIRVEKPIYDANRYSCKEMGVLFSKNGTIPSLEDVVANDTLAYGNAGNGIVSKGYVNGEKIGAETIDGYAAYTPNISFANGNPIYTRNYIIMTNKETNEDMILYGNYYVTTLNS